MGRVSQRFTGELGDRIEAKTAEPPAPLKRKRMQEMAVYFFSRTTSSSENDGVSVESFPCGPSFLPGFIVSL